MKKIKSEVNDAFYPISMRMSQNLKKCLMFAFYYIKKTKSILAYFYYKDMQTQIKKSIFCIFYMKNKFWRKYYIFKDFYMKKSKWRKLHILAYYKKVRKLSMFVYHDTKERHSKICQNLKKMVHFPIFLYKKEESKEKELLVHISQWKKTNSEEN